MTSPTFDTDDGRFVRPRRWVRWRRFAHLAPATAILIATNLVWFVLVEGFHGFTDTGYLAAGALYGPDVASGQWYRLISAMFVHAGPLHVGLNMVSLASLYLVEPLVGTRRYILLYFLSGVAGNLVTYWTLPDAIALGASGAIFGIFGAALALSFLGVLPKSARNQLLILLVINLVYGFSNADIDNLAHIAGLVTGGALTVGFRRWPWPASVLRVSAIVITVATGVSLLMAAII